ncbi:MAG: hypothetical protein HQM08_02695 [Candidatus Riflebacteria bacterium]|nr:hypothetical protein [Candidatus Riflebacteria bacterium]
MTSLNKIFDRDEMVRVARTGIENSLKFYMTLNENIVKLSDLQKETINETTKKNLEALNKTYDEFQKNHRVLTSRVETFYRDLLEKVITPKEETGSK